MVDVWIMYKKKLKNESIFSISVLIVALMAYYVSTIYFSEKVDYWTIAIICFFIIAVIARFVITIFRINNEWYGNNESECREIIEYLYEVGLIFDSNESNIHWWADVKDGVIRPVTVIPPTSTIWQKIPNIFRRYPNKRHKYFFRCLDRNGNFGKKLTKENIFVKSEDAVKLLESVKK